MDRFDETWQRLRQWTAGQAQAEALAAQIVASQGEGFTRLDPSHPHGGPDGAMDAELLRDGDKFVMAAYFPRGQKDFSQIRKKFKADLAGVATNAATGIAFVTNQELKLSERSALKKLAQPHAAELYHLDRISSILDRPEMSGVREQFLGIPQIPAADIVAEVQRSAQEVTQRLESVQTGGDTFCYAMLYDFSLTRNIARQFVFIKVGEFTLYDLRMRMVQFPGQREIMEVNLGEHNDPARFEILEFALPERLYVRVFFSARNGAWHQDLQLIKSEEDGFWPAATRVIGRNGRDVLFSHIDNEFVKRFGAPEWSY